MKKGLQIYNKKHVILCIILSSSLYVLTDAKPCVSRDYGNGGTVCICNADYCDTVAAVEPVASPNYIQYTSSKDGLRFEKTQGTFQQVAATDLVIRVDSTITYQDIKGWGGAFTDSTGININLLNQAAQDNLMNSYFSKDGIEYSLCRVPIGGTDFSTRPYSYDDVSGDKNLTYFQLQKEDILYKIPYIQKALKLTNNNMLLLASAWSAPPWMKTFNSYAGISFLLNEMYQTWADYHIKFFECYEKEGIHFWGVTTGNEPSNGYSLFNKINSMGWTANGMGNWIAQNLGPTLRNSKYSNIKIITIDDRRIFIPWWIALLFKNEEAKEYVSGIGIHWYLNYIAPPILLTITYKKYPDKFLLSTEACAGSRHFEEKVSIGSWIRGEMYVKDIIENIQHYASGWIDWNMVLDLTGGPTYINNFVDSPILVNATAQEFYKQPMYYGLGHFSKFVPPGSLVIDVRSPKICFPRGLQSVAFKRPDDGTVVVIFNQEDLDYNITILNRMKGITLFIPKRSFNTILYW